MDWGMWKRMKQKAGTENWNGKAENGKWSSDCSNDNDFILIYGIARLD